MSRGQNLNCLAVFFLDDPETLYRGDLSVGRGDSCFGLRFCRGLRIGLQRSQNHSQGNDCTPIAPKPITTPWLPQRTSGPEIFHGSTRVCSKHITASCNQEVTDEMTLAMKGTSKTITPRWGILRFCQKLILVDDGGHGHLTGGATFDSNHAAFAAHADAFRKRDFGR